MGVTSGVRLVHQRTLRSGRLRFRGTTVYWANSCSVLKLATLPTGPESPTDLSCTATWQMSRITLRSIGGLGTVSIWRHWFRHLVTPIQTSMRAIPQRHSTLMWALGAGTTMACLERPRFGPLPTRVNHAVMTSIKDVNGNIVLTVSGNLDSGNQQAHNDNN